MSTVDLLIIGLYLVGMIAIGFFARGQIETMDDFILGGRRFSSFALIGTIMATMVGSGMTMGAVGNAYKYGATGTVFWMYAGFALGLIFFGLLAGKIRETGKRTMAEVISEKFGNSSRLVASIVIILYAISIVAINIAGLRNIIIYVFGEGLTISLPVATAIAAIISIGYTSIGGFFAVVYTDVVQLIIMIIGIFILGPIIGLTQTGGFAPIATAFADAGMSMTNPFVGGVSAGSVGFFLAYFLAVPGDPTMPQRALAAKDYKTARSSFLVTGAMGFYFGIVLLLLGGVMFVLHPGLENAEAALPIFVLNHYPPVLRGITIAGIIAAIMSSFDSFLILATTHLMYDMGHALKQDVNEERLNKAMPVATVVIGLIGLIIALYIQSLFAYLYMVFSIVGAALVPALLAALFFSEKTSKTAVVLSILTGTIVPAGLYLTVGYNVFLGDPVFLGLIASVAVLVVGSMALKDKPEERAASEAK
ncbi:solute:Na+ symporter, SSS family [Dethiosulfatibacter aminovorans DSM 17477]|uniref:Solute:Na+ symporter, SSS family n=1 Tax=Dethiosulfatibacter aminovorans DSM 17477 TaxID=1121476 RepID=A0A1M6KNM2_9FIRM|nr:sodium:solute symporter family protein [Dethiosulfatibacter aminovorans]SHJ60521.1 solute:Na+ symporter, SSS family [Dethiosulfatibacter aminovorans DSM 17477]